MNALIESMYIFLYDFEQQVVLKAIDPSFSLDELKLANRPDVESISNVSNAPSGLARMGLLITTNPQGVSAHSAVVCLADATINHGLLCPRLLNPCSSRDSLSVIGAASPMAVSGGFSMCSNGIEIGGIHSQRACRMKESGWTGSVACGEVSEDLFKQHAAYESQKSRQTFKDRLGTLYCIVLFSVSLTGHNSSDRNKPSSLFSRNIAPQPIALVGIADKSFATFVIGMEKMSSSLPFELAISNTNISDNKAATVIGNYDSLVTEEVSVAFLLDMVTGDLYQVIKSRGKFKGMNDSSHNYRFVLHTAENYEVLHVNAQTIPPLRNGDDKTFQICGSTTIASPNQVSLHLSYTLSTVGDSSAGKSPRSTHRSLLANRQVTTQPITDAGEARVRIVVRGRDMHNLVFPCTRSSFMQLVPMCQIYTQICVVEML